MNFLEAALTLLPVLAELIKKALESTSNDEEAKAFLMYILGSSEENQIRIQMAISKARALDALK